MAEREEKKGTQNKGEAIQTRRQEGGTLERTGAFPGLWNENPFTFMRRMTEEMDRVFGSLVPGSRFGGGRSARQMMWSPSIEAFQKDDKFIVRAELPGLKKDDVEVNITEDSIVLQGQRQHEHEEHREGFYHSERSYGSFYRAIPLPEGVIADSAEASFKDGVLEVTLQAPPNEVSRGRRIEVKDASQQRPQK
jgi:HSP20 family protein